MSARWPLVSILVTTFNSERYLAAALDSAFAQTYPEFEVVLVDGGSADRTREIAERYAGPRLRAFFSGKRLGIKEARNMLLREARGEFLTFLDADDIYLPEKIAEEVTYLETHPGYAAVYCDLRYFFDGAPEKLYRHRFTFYSGDLFGKLLERMFITNTAFMFRRSVYESLGGYDESLGMVEDWDYFLRMAHAGHRIGFVPKDLVRYRLRWDNHTRFENQVPIQESAVRIFEHLAARMTPEEARHYHMRKFLRAHLLRLAAVYFAMGWRKEGCAALRRAWPRCGAAACFAAGLVPVKLARFAVEGAWNIKKTNLFVPVDSRDPGR